MQVQHSPAWTMPVLAFCLSLIFSLVLAPTLGLVAYQQYDFWLLWAVSMLFLALPLTILEIALAKRVKNSPLQGFMQLTRDADRSTRWRILSWAAALFVPLLAGGMLYFAAQQVQQQFALTLAPSLVVLALLVFAVALSCIPRLILFILMAIATLALVVIGIVTQPEATWQWTAIEFNEWAKVVTLIVVTGGLGLGVYWQSALQAAKTKQAATPIALPICLAQALGLGIFAFVSDITSSLQAIALCFAVLALAALLLQLVREQLLARHIALPIQALILLLPLLVWAVPQSGMVLFPFMVICGLLLVLGYAIFVGWLMKISHLRKSIQFSSEAIYNLWRIMIRIVVPLSVILALFGWLLAWVG